MFARFFRKGIVMAKVLFIQKTLAENIGIMQLSAILKAGGHRCQMLMLGRPTAADLEAVRREEADIVGFSVMSNDRQWAVEVATRLKQAGVKGFFIAGGPHPTFFPDFVEQECFDAINIGEADYSLIELAEALDKKQPWEGIRNLSFKRDGKVVTNPLHPLARMDQLPLPDREIYLDKPDYARQQVYYFSVSRGCPFNCAFCFVHNFKALYKGDPAGNRARLRSPASLIEEYRALAARVNVSLINFVDSSFNLDKRWTMEFLREYGKQVKVPFTVNIAANLVDEEIVKAFADTGCCQYVRIGVETGNEDLRRKVLNKKLSNHKIADVFRLFNRHGIDVVAYNMMGLPGETVENAYETIALNQRIKPKNTIVWVFNPFPGLQVTKYAVDKGFYREPGPGAAGACRKASSGFSEFFYSKLEQPGIDEVENLCMLSMLAINVPFLTPLIKLLAKLPPNALFKKIYLLSYARQFAGVQRIGFRQALQIARTWT